VKRLKTLERGHIYFFYRPKVDRPSARGLADIRRLYVVMHPHQRRIYRLIIIAEKRLPDVTGRGDRKSWGFVEKVGRRPEDVEDDLDPETYVTRTRGERHLPAARPAGEGVYALVPHEGTPIWPTRCDCRGDPAPFSARCTSSRKAATS